LEVSISAYARCVAASACSEASSTLAADAPQTYVTQSQAADYCRFAGKRLPTEAEWEKAARGTEGAFYPWGGADPSCQLANYGGCGGQLASVISYLDTPSAYGTVNLAGNVAEWTSTAASGGRHIIRGGDYTSPESELPGFSRVSYPSAMGAHFLGFRCVRDAN
jgi:formylglycine-generating enzyme required for sulfatase activity